MKPTLLNILIVIEFGKMVALSSSVTQIETFTFISIFDLQYVSIMNLV